MKFDIYLKCSRFLGQAILSLFAIAGFSGMVSAQSITNVTVPQGNISLTGRLYRPTGAGPFPAVVVMHGSGGMWNNDDVSQGMITHLKEWGTLLQTNGYVALFIDSYKPRGIPGDYKNKRPCFDSAWDDALCSPAYERTKDAYAALFWLRQQATAPVISSRIGLLGFSQGGEAALAAVVSGSISKNPWKVGYITSWKKDANGNILKDSSGIPIAASTDYNHTVPAPYKPWAYTFVSQGIIGPVYFWLPVPEAQLFASVVAYYPGCGFYGYFGSVTGTTAGNYMPYTKTLVLHGTEDSLWKSTYPAALMSKTISQANTLNVSNPMTQITYEDAKHSFDMATLAPQSQWNTANESADQFAKRVARTDALNHLNATLKAP